MRFRLQVAILLLLAPLTVNLGAVAQAAENWKALSHEQFAGDATGQLKAKTAQRPEVEAEAKRRLLETDAATSASYATLGSLAAWGAPQLSSDEKTTIAGKIDTRKDHGMKMEFAELQARSTALRRLDADELADKGLLAWIDAHDPASLEVPTIEWLCCQLGQSKHRGDRIQIEWTGFLKLEKQGLYTFSPSAICTDRDWGGGRIRSYLRVTLGGSEIINTVQNGWQTASQPILLDNTRELSIKVSFAHDRERNSLGQSCPAIAMLYWKGPGFERQLIPASAFKPAEGQGPGLNAHYKLQEMNRETKATKLVAEFKRIDPQIDAAWWQSQNTGFRPRPAQLDKLLDHLATRYNNADYLEKFRTENDARGKREFDQWRQISELMTTPQRQKFLQALLDNPKFIAALRLQQVRRLHQYFYPGNDERAIELLGPWLHAQSDLVAPAFLAQSRPVNGEFQTLADDVAMLPTGAAYLRDKLVARPDGSCCLLAAFLSAYLGTYESDREAFINFVDKRLANLDLGGDRRVGWLIARAAAEGLRSNKPRHLYMITTAGWPWLEEAMDAAESEPVKLLVARHQAVRLLDAGEKARLARLLPEFEQQLSSQTAHAEIAKWREALGKLGVVAVGAQSLTDLEHTDYLKVIKLGEKNAERRNDPEAAARYRALIEKHEAKKGEKQ
jgi:hypothetical protein